MLNDLDASLLLALGILAGVGALLCLLTYHEPTSTEGTEDPRWRWSRSSSLPVEHPDR